MYRNILLPTDGTEFCQRAIEHAAELAKFVGAKVIGVTVLPPLHSSAPRGFVPENLARIVHEQREKIAAANLAGVEKAAKAAGVTFETVRETDDHPWQGILRVAEGKGCDLIVMASHGRRGVAGLVLGSETHKVLTHASVPVLVVR